MAHSEMCLIQTRVIASFTVAAREETSKSIIADEHSYLCDNTPLETPDRPSGPVIPHVPGTRHHRAHPAPGLHPVGGLGRLLHPRASRAAPRAYRFAGVGTADRDLPLDLPADGLLIETFPWTCPLTFAETWLEQRAGNQNRGHSYAPS